MSEPMQASVHWPYERAPLATAGLQAAIIAAQRGHRVVPYERERVAGGRVRLVASVPNQAEFSGLVRNQFAERRRLGVEIRCGETVQCRLRPNSRSRRRRDRDRRRSSETVVGTGTVPPVRLR